MTETSHDPYETRAGAPADRPAQGRSEGVQMVGGACSVMQCGREAAVRRSSMRVCLSVSAAERPFVFSGLRRDRLTSRQPAAALPRPDAAEGQARVKLR